MGTFLHLFCVILIISIFNKWGGGVWVRLLGGQEPRARVSLALRECMWNAPTASLVFPVFYDTGFLGNPSRRVVYPPWFLSGYLTLISLRGIGRLGYNPSFSLRSYFSVISCLSSSFNLPEI